jgi:hypothetical protein
LSKNYQKLNPYYVCGFVDGEGSFNINIGKHNTTKCRYEVRMAFEIELRADNREILERIRTTLECGGLYFLDYKRYGWNPHYKYRVQKQSDIDRKIIPFFKKYPLQGCKAKSFEIFAEAFNVIKRKEHLTLVGVDKLKEYQHQMRLIGKKRKTFR